MVFAQTAQVDDAGNAGGACGGGEVLRARGFALFEAARVPHRVDKVVRHVDVLERRGQRGRIQDVAGDDLRAAADTRREVRGVTRETANLVASCFEDRQEASPDVAGCAGQEDCHWEFDGIRTQTSAYVPNGTAATLRPAAGPAAPS